jgi:putative transposase
MHPYPSAQEFRTFFLTFVTAGRRPLFRVERNADLLMGLFASDCVRCRYRLHAWVAMPDHVHLILTPAQDVSLEKAVQFIKGGFSFQSKLRSDVWQRGFAEHRIEDAEDFEWHVEYIARNPVRAGLAASLHEYSWSHLSHPGSVTPMPRHFKVPGAKKAYSWQGEIRWSSPDFSRVICHG